MSSRPDLCAKTGPLSIPSPSSSDKTKALTRSERDQPHNRRRLNIGAGVLNVTPPISELWASTKIFLTERPDN